MVTLIEVYEVVSPSIPDMFLDEQVAAGCNDWKAETSDGASFIGRSHHEAEHYALTWCDSCNESE